MSVRSGLLATKIRPNGKMTGQSVGGSVTVTQISKYVVPSSVVYVASSIPTIASANLIRMPNHIKCMYTIHKSK